MKKNILFIVSMAYLVLIIGCSKGKPAEYPDKKVVVVVPYSAGGGSDSIVRALVNSAKESFPENIIVENRTGGGGAVGMLYGANAKPDGYTISMVAVELTILPHLGTGGALTYDLFRPVLLFNSDYSAITVKSDSQWNNLEDFLASAGKENLSVGNSGVGSIWHFAAAALGKEANVEFNAIPFDGAAPAITSLLGGHIDAVSVSYPEVASYVKSGDLKILGYLAPQGIANDPTILTAKEQGYDVEVSTWRGLSVPKDTPDEIVTKIYDIFLEAAETESFKKFMQENGFGIELQGPDVFEKRIETNDLLYAKLVEQINFN